MAKYKILSTKKLEPSLVKQAKQNDFEIIEQEFISIKPVWNKEIADAIPGLTKEKKIYIAFTSANAVDTLNSYMVAYDIYYAINWRIFCLSGKTRLAIQNSKFLKNNIVGEANNASELAQQIIEAEADEIIFFCGNKRRDELPVILKNAKIKVHEVVLYETTERPVMVDNNFDAILFFSPSAVKSFFQSNQLNDQTILFAIGSTTANEAKKSSKNKIVISDKPEEKSLLEKAINYFQTDSQFTIHHSK